MIDYCEQAFLKSIRRYLNPRAEGEPSAAEDPDTSRLKAFDWGAETLDVDWRGIFRLALKAQVRPRLSMIACQLAMSSEDGQAGWTVRY